MKEHSDLTMEMPYYGIYFLKSPILVVNDVELAKQILVKDFDNFINRRGGGFTSILNTGQRVDTIWSKVSML